MCFEKKTSFFNLGHSMKYIRRKIFARVLITAFWVSRRNVWRNLQFVEILSTLLDIGRKQVWLFLEIFSKRLRKLHSLCQKEHFARKRFLNSLLLHIIFRGCSENLRVLAEAFKQGYQNCIQRVHMIFFRLKQVFLK